MSEELDTYIKIVISVRLTLMTIFIVELMTTLFKVGIRIWFLRNCILT